MLKGKTVVLGVTGSIAAYKMANVASMLVKLHADVHVIMTENACQFITPVTFETLTGNKCMVDTFDRNFQFHVAHISIAKKADVLLVAPASANVIGKLANGIADDMLTTTAMACTCQKIVAPAMNTNMYHNPILQDNLKKLEGYGFTVIEPATGMLACKDVGSGKLPEPEKRMIDLLVCRRQGFAVLNIISAVPDGPDPGRETCDELKIIKRIIQKYNGFLTTESNGGFFAIKAVFPVQ